MHPATHTTFLPPPCDAQQPKRVGRNRRTRNFGIHLGARRSAGEAASAGVSAEIMTPSPPTPAISGGK
jgi:hypothetical protein